MDESYNELTPAVLLNGYASGIFPMAVPEVGNDIYWFAPDPRAIIPLDGFHVSKSLRRTLKKKPFEVVCNRDFEGTMRACAAPRQDDEKTWISEEVINAYCRLHDIGYAHSIECYKNDELVGGLYGVALGGAFFGESMFHLERDASKVALYYLVEHLKSRGYVLLDVQYVTGHLETLGAIEIAREEYERLLHEALEHHCTW